jgi:hypothetical protein
MWKFVDGAKTAGELYGRALVVIAAEHYAAQLVVPNSQRGFGLAWGSHKGHAIKALERGCQPMSAGSGRAVCRRLDRELGEVAQSEAIVRADARARLLMGRLRELGSQVRWSSGRGGVHSASWACPSEDRS